MKSYTVRNEAGQSFEVDEDRVSEAEKDGYLPVVYNGTEEHRVSFADLSKAKADGYSPRFSSDVSGIESGVMGAAKGASFGFADELAGALEVGGGLLGVRGMGGRFSDTRLESDAEDKQSIAEIYRGARDAKRKDYEDAKEANPASFTTGEVGGAIATSMAPGMGFMNAAKGAAAATVIGKGALQGGIYGLNDSEADLTKGEFGDAAIDAAKGAALGGAGAGLVHGAVKGAGYVGDKIANTKSWQAIEGWVSTLPEKMQKKARQKAVEALNPTLSQLERLKAGPGMDRVGGELLENGILKNRLGLPTGIGGIYENLDSATSEVGRRIGGQLEEIQKLQPDFSIPSEEVAEAIKKVAVEPNIQTPFWKGAKAVNAEADVIRSWDRNFTLPELNQFKSELGKRIKTWGSDNLSDKKVYEDMYDAINNLIESNVEQLGGAQAIAGKVDLKKIAGASDEEAMDMMRGLVDDYEAPLKEFKGSKSSYGSLAEASKIAKKAVARNEKNNDIGLTTWLAGLTGIGGGMVGGLSGGAAGIGLGAALAGGRAWTRAYGNQTAALLLDRLSKAPAPIAKLSPAIKRAAEASPEALSSTLYVLAKDRPEFNEWLNSNPPEPSQPGKLQAREEEAGIEEEGFLDVFKPMKQMAAKGLRSEGYEGLATASEYLLPDSPLEIRPSFKGAKSGVVANPVKRGDGGRIADRLAREDPIVSRPVSHEGQTLKHVIFDDGDGSGVTHMLYGDQGPVASINLTRTIHQGSPTWAISHSASAASGQGWGKKLYDLVADTHGEIVSDLSLSPKGSHRVYAEHFPKQPGVEVELGAWDTYDRHKVKVTSPEEFRAGLGTEKLDTSFLNDMTPESDPFPLPKGTPTTGMPEGIQPESAMGVLIARLRSEDPLTRASAQRAYENMPPHIQEALDRALGKPAPTPKRKAR